MSGGEEIEQLKNNNLNFGRYYMITIVLMLTTLYIVKTAEEGGFRLDLDREKTTGRKT